MPKSQLGFVVVRRLGEAEGKFDWSHNSSNKIEAVVTCKIQNSKFKKETSLDATIS
jgi:hypothetical protein